MKSYYKLRLDKKIKHLINYCRNSVLILFLIISSSVAAAENSIFERVWKFEINTIDLENTVQAKPKEFQDLLLFVDGDGHFFALDKYTGSLVYKVKLGAMAGRRGFALDQDLGLVAITGSVAKRVGLEAGATLFLLDARSGKILKETPTNWSVVEPIFTPECIVTFGARKGIIQCHDRDLEQVIWRTELGAAGRIWSNPSISEKHNMIYLVTGDSGHIVPENVSDEMYSSSLIGMSARTGSVIFSRQMIKTGVWDFDGVGKPILIENFANDDGKIYDLVVGLNKTGTVFVLNAVDGTPIKNKQFNEVVFDTDIAQDAKLSKTQTIPAWPARVSEISLKPEDLRMEKVRFQSLRHAKYGDFLAPSLDYDVVTLGLHGGPEWSGGEYFKSSGEDFLAVPYNNNSWILRLLYVEDFWLGSKIYSVIWRIKKAFNYFRNLFLDDGKLKSDGGNDALSDSRWVQTIWSDDNDRAQWLDKLYPLLKRKAYNEKYYKNCASCHRNDRGGKFQSELQGDGYIPSLVGYTLTEKFKFGSDYSQLTAIHDQELGVTKEELNEIFQHFNKYDEEQLTDNKLKVTGFWQTLLAKDTLPLNKGPWGGIAVLNLSSGEKIKDIVVGEMKDAEGNIFDSSIIFGGIGKVNAKGESLLVGTVDSRAYYVSLPEGKVVQTVDLERSGSAPPLLISINGCEAWVIVETGGRFSFYDRSRNGFTIETFINKSRCE